MGLLEPAPAATAVVAQGGAPAPCLRRRLLLGAAAALVLLIGAVAAAILHLCDGRFFYSFDDAYISLNVGWHLAHGTYGVNAGEAASPCSSILYPLLLAAFAWCPWQALVPLFVNTAAALATGLVFAAALLRYGIVAKPKDVPDAVLLVLLLCLATDTVALVFTGLEHSLHLLVSVFVVLRLARAIEEDRVSPSLVAAVVLLPLLRFEGIALALLVIMALLVVGHWRPALVAALGIAATIGLYMAAMHRIGLPLLPSSVLAKSPIARQAAAGTGTGIGAGAAMAAAILANLMARLRSGTVPVLVVVVPAVLVAALVIAHPLRRAFRPAVPAVSPPVMTLRREMVFALVVAGAQMAQLMFGQQWNRYDAYATAISLMGILVLWRRHLCRLIAAGGPGRWGIFAAALLVVGHFFIGTAVAPFAARGNYELQYQMHRFAAEFYRAPVAVNDLGLVSYHNPYYVLDLWGLGSEAARRARQNPSADPHWMDRLAHAHRVGVAMIFDDWFAGAIPANWQRLAVLRAPHVPDILSFYATSPPAAAAALAALRRFRASLIPGTSLTIADVPNR